jgi:hypothetical protein
MGHGVFFIPKKGLLDLAHSLHLHSFPFYCFFSFFLFSTQCYLCQICIYLFRKTLLIYTSIYESITAVPLHTGCVPCSDLCHNMNYSQA